MHDAYVTSPTRKGVKVRLPMFLLVSLVATVALSVGACGAGDEGVQIAAKGATKVKQLWGETADARYVGKKGYKIFKKVDPDLDGIVGENDNCPTVFNIDQANSDLDGLGDACDDAADYDIDGVEDAVDNCIYVINPRQPDLDEDDEGDACDEDMDGDSLPNTSVFETDMDGDGFSSSDDSDNDGDGFTKPTDRFDWDPAYY